jgi:hypothetical protein
MRHAVPVGTAGRALNPFWRGGGAVPAAILDRKQ